MGIFESITEPLTHKQEIKEILDDAQNKYDKAKDQLETQKERTSKKLENLGKVKVKAWSEGMEGFASAFRSFKNIEIIKKLDTNTNFVGCNVEPQQMLMNIESASMTAGEVAKAGFAAVGTGALVGIASYGGAMMFGSASTGTAIAALNGAAKTNATLAWFGGGAKAAGGLGMAGGKFVLAGIVVAPIIAVAAAITGAKGNANLAEANKIHAETEKAVSEMRVVITGMEGVARITENYTDFIKKLNKKFMPFVAEIRKIESRHLKDPEGKIDFDSLTIVEQKTLHISWLMAQIYYHVLSTPILTANGKISDEAKQSIRSSKKDLRKIRRETFKMTDVVTPVGDIVWKPFARKIMIICFLAIGLFIFGGVLMIRDEQILKGILMMLCSAIAFPIFVYFRNLPESRKYVFRLLRLIVSMILAVLILIV